MIADVHELYDQGLKWLEDEDNCWLLFGTTFLMVLLPGKVEFCGVKIKFQLFRSGIERIER